MEPGAFETLTGVAVTAITADEMRAVDRVAVEDVGLELLQMMENAGRTLAARVLALDPASVLVVAGDGGNGGGGLVCARHLANHDVPVEVVLDREPDRLTGVTAHQRRILEAMAVPIARASDGIDDRDEPAVLVDALIGYGLGGNVREPAAGLIRAMNRATGTVVSLDVPSGVDASTGETLGLAVDPDRTITLALPKTGLLDRAEPLELADIAIPRAAYDRLDIPYRPPFGPAAWVELIPRGGDG